jgi:hypothetical protein
MHSSSKVVEFPWACFNCEDVFFVVQTLVKAASRNVAARLRLDDDPSSSSRSFQNSTSKDTLKSFAHKFLYLLCMYLRSSSIQPHIRPVLPSISMTAQFKVRYAAESTWVSDLSPTPELCNTLLKTNIDATFHPSKLLAITTKAHNFIHHHHHRVCLPPRYHPSSCVRSCFSAYQKSYRCHRSL